MVPSEPDLHQHIQSCNSRLDHIQHAVDALKEALSTKQRARSLRTDKREETFVDHFARVVSQDLASDTGVWR
jgi:hypothetical protein